LIPGLEYLTIQARAEEPTANLVAVLLGLVRYEADDQPDAIDQFTRAIGRIAPERIEPCAALLAY
jgi:hypothetical protein